MKTCAIYARISETVPGRDKVADQIAACHEFAVRRGYEVVLAFQDDGVSALGGKERAGFAELAAAAAAGKFDVIVATEEERLARNVPEKTELQLVAAAAGVTWDTIRDGFVDPSTDSGEFLSTLRAAMGRMESKRKADRQRAANLHRAARGQSNPGKRRYGYETDGATPRSEEARIVRRIYVDISKGATLRGIATSLRTEGVDPGTAKAWTTGHVRYIAANPAYRGAVRHLGEVVDSEHVKPIVERELWESVQVILSDPTRKTSPGNVPKHLLSGVAKCACGETLFFRNGYICRASASHAFMLKDQAEGIVRNGLVEALLLRGAVKPAPTSNDHLRLITEHARLTTALNDTAEDRELGFLPRDIARERLRKLAAQREAVEAELTVIKTAQAADAVLVDLAHDLLGDADAVELADLQGIRTAILDRFDGLSFERQREALRGLVKITLHKGRSLDRLRVVPNYERAIGVDPEDDAASILRSIADED